MLKIVLGISMQWKWVIMKQVLWYWKFVGVIVSISLEKLLMVNRMMKVMVNSIGVLKVSEFFYMVVIQLNIFILVGIVISMVVYMKNSLLVIGMLIMNMWCVQIMKERKVMLVVVQIIEVQLNSGLCVKVGMIVLIVLKVGRIMMYILGWLKNQNMCWNSIGLLLLVVLKKLVLKWMFISIMVIMLVSIGIIVISRNVVISQVQMNSGIFIRVMFGVCRLRMVVIMLIVFMIELILVRWMVKMKKVMLCGVKVVDSGVQKVQLKLGLLLGMNRVLISRLKVVGSSQKLKLFICGRVMFGVLIISGIIQLVRLMKVGIIVLKIMIRLCMVVIWLKNVGLMICRLGWNSLVWIIMVIELLSRNIMKLNYRQRVLMFLWLVVSIQCIRFLVGLWWWLLVWWLGVLIIVFMVVFYCCFCLQMMMFFGVIMLLLLLFQVLCLQVIIVVRLILLSCLLKVVMVVLGMLLKIIFRWCFLGLVMIFEFFSVGNIGGMFWFLVWWQVVQMVWQILLLCVINFFLVYFLLVSFLIFVVFFLCLVSYWLNLVLGLMLIMIGMKLWFLLYSLVYWL